MLCNNAKVGVSISFSFFFWGGGVGDRGVYEKFRLPWGGVQRKMKATQGGVQDSYMDYYKLFLPTPGDKYWLVPYYNQNMQIQWVILERSYFNTIK